MLSTIDDSSNEPSATPLDDVGHTVEVASDWPCWADDDMGGNLVSLPRDWNRRSSD